MTDEIVTLLSGSLKFIGTDPEIVERLAGLTKLLGASVEAAVQGQPPYLVATEVLAGLAVASFVESVAAPAILADIIVTGLEDIGLVAVSTSTVTASTTAVTADTAITAVAAYIIENRADALTSITADVQSDPYDAQAIKAIVALAPALFQGSGGPNSTSVPQAPSTVGFSTVQNTLFLVFGNLGLPTGSQVVSYLPDGSSITLSYTSPDGSGTPTAEEIESAYGTSEFVTYGTNGSFAANVYSSPQGTGAITKQYSGTTPNVVFATGLQLWDTDGTAGGTQQLDISGASSTGINPRQITVSGRLAIFEGASLAGEQVWASDGTSTGTVELTSLTPNAYVSILPAQPNGKVLFTVTVGSTYNQLGVTDGTAAGTKLLSYGGKPIASVYDATVIQGGALFYASIGAGTSLWFTNGTEAGTNELTPAAIPYNPVGDLTPIGALDYFVAGTTNNAFTSVSELWSTGGTSAGTAPLAGSAGLNPIDLVNVDGTLLFSSNGQTWSVDTNGPYKLGPIANAAASGFKIANITPFGNDALFVALDAQAHEELWITDGTSYGTTELTSPMLNGAAANIGASSLVVSGSHAFFEGVDKTGAESLWVTDGTPGGTHDLSLLPSSGGTSIQPLDLTSFDGGVLFDAFDNTYRDGELWYSDGTVAGSIQLSAVGNYFGTDEGLSPNDITVVGNAALFQGTDGQADVGLWSTDGTAAGTQEISLVSATALSRIAGSINVACYARGTFILTPAGEVLVENLTSDRRVVTHDGRVCQVRWIGRRSYAGQSLAANQGLHPIVFRSGSLGGGLPRRDLLVSPLHAMFIDGVLIPAQALVNGTTIVREHGLDRIDYFHVELDQHDVLLAEGAPSETFLDDNSRRTFENASEYSALYPNPTMPRGYCAPRVESGPVLAAIRQRLEGIGVQEVRIESDGTHTVPIRDGVRALRLITASGHVPGDARRLGAAIGRIAIDGLNLPLDDMRLATGWHDCEERWRWTDGGALMLVAGAREIEVTLVSFPFALAA